MYWIKRRSVILQSLKLITYLNNWQYNIVINCNIDLTAKAYLSSLYQVSLVFVQYTTMCMGTCILWIQLDSFGKTVKRKPSHVLHLLAYSFPNVSFHIATIFLQNNLIKSKSINKLVPWSKNIRVRQSILPFERLQCWSHSHWRTTGTRQRLRALQETVILNWVSLSPITDIFFHPCHLVKLSKAAPLIEKISKSNFKAIRCTEVTKPW